MASKRKSTFGIYLNNLIAYLTFRILYFFYPPLKTHNKNILFINTGQIGDVTISSLIMENENELQDDRKYYFLVRDNYVSVFNDYSGKIKIIPIDEGKYKRDPKYKIKTIQKLRSLNLEKCFNLTSARGVRNDEIALLTGASEVYCFSNSWKNLKKLYSSKMDSFYTKVLFHETDNEYERHLKLLNEHFNIDKTVLAVKNKNVFKTSQVNTDKFITIAPFSTEPSRCWSIENFYELCERLTGRFKVLVLGSKEQFEICEDAFSGLENVSNLCGKNNIPEAATLISVAMMHIGNDSGLTHVALKMGTPTLGIVGGYYFGKFFPFEYDGLHGKYFYKKMDCFGCEWSCIHDEPYCFTDVTVDEVYSEVLTIINSCEHKPK